MNMVLKPMSLAAMPAQSTCECRRSSSAMTTRMYWARGGGFKAGQLFHGLAERESVDERADAAHALHERDDLKIVARLGQMLDAAEVEADMQLGVLHGFAFADHVELVGFFKAGMVGPHGDLVAHFATSFCPGVPAAGLSRRRDLAQIHARLVALAQQQRLVVAAREVDGEYLRGPRARSSPRPRRGRRCSRCELPAIMKGKPSRRPSRSQ